MQYHFFNIPALNPEAAEQQLNAFLASNGVLSLKREFVNDAANSFWAISVCLTTPINKVSQESKTRNNKRVVDYREILSPEHFTIYARLRTLRNKIAEEQNTPAYAVFTNEQLGAMAQLNECSLQALEKIDGVGEKRLKLYGEAFLAALEQGDA